MRRLGFLIAAAFLVAACGGDNPAAPPVVATVQVAPGQDTLVTLGRTRQFTASALDAQGAPVSGVTIVWSSSNPGVATVDPTTGVVTAVANGLSVIRATAGTGPSAVTGQATLAVSQVVATVVVTPPSGSLSTVGATVTFAAVAKDSSNATVAGVRFVWQSSDHTVAIVDTVGVARSKGPGQAIITAVGRGIPGNAVLTVTQLAATLVFVGAPSSVVAGDPFPTVVQVEIRDSAGAVVTGSHTPVTIVAETGPAGFLSGTLTVVPNDGVATFIGVTFNGFVGTHTLRATAAGIGSGDSPDFEVVPAAVSQIAWTGGGADDVVGDIQGDWTFQLHDRFGNLAFTTTDSVYLSVAASPWGSHLRGPTAALPVDGTATFSGFTLDRPGHGVRLAATVNGITSAPSPARRDTLPPLTEVAVADEHMCAVGSSRAFCWGRNEYGDIGNGTRLADSVPVLVESPVAFTGIAAGSGFTCALGAGAAYCWGRDLESGLADTLPVAVPGGISFTELSAGQDHVCGLTSAGDVYCWGSNFYGQLGDARVNGFFSTTPVLVAGGHTFTELSAGYLSTCAIATGGAAYCWGWGFYGQLGTGSTTDDSVPTLVQGGLQFAHVTQSGVHACALKADSLAYCWGANVVGQLGDSTTAPDSVPVAVHGGHKFTALAAGGGFTCGIATGGAVWCWGSTLAVSSPVPLFEGFTADALFAGPSNGCALSAGALRCWGNNGDFQIGDGTRIDRIAPQPTVTQAPRRR